MRSETASMQLAGAVDARCTCCADSQPLVPHGDLDGTRLVCPATALTYLDRGDGWYDADGDRVNGHIPVPTAPNAAAELLSDRPTRTGPKTRIALEKATFASSSEEARQ